MLKPRLPAQMLTAYIDAAGTMLGESAVRAYVASKSSDAAPIIRGWC